jgi:hypothetical protein
MKLKEIICKVLHNFILTIVLKDYYKGSNVVNARKKHLKDVLNVRMYGTVQETVKWRIGHNTKSNATQG